LAQAHSSSLKWRERECQVGQLIVRVEVQCVDSHKL